MAGDTHPRNRALRGQTTRPAQQEWKAGSVRASWVLLLLSVGASSPREVKLACLLSLLSFP